MGSIGVGMEFIAKEANPDGLMDIKMEVKIRMAWSNSLSIGTTIAHHSIQIGRVESLRREYPRRRSAISIPI